MKCHGEQRECNLAPDGRGRGVAECGGLIKDEIPVAGFSQNTATTPLVWRAFRKGASSVCTAETMLQKPPAMEKLPPLIAPASGWPMVPVTEYAAPVRVPLLLPTVNRSMENWAWPAAASASRAYGKEVGCFQGIYHSTQLERDRLLAGTKLLFS